MPPKKTAEKRKVDAATEYDPPAKTVSRGPTDAVTVDSMDRAKRGAYSLFDHSFFPDTVILRVRNRNFTVSASYLAMNSLFFYDLFYGPNSPGLNGRYVLDCDPHTFGDLLDMVYPCYKKTNCCKECADSAIDRFSLAVKMKLRSAVRRLVEYSDSKQRDELMRIVKDQNAWDEFAYLFPADGDNARVKETHVLSKVDSFPDAATVVVNGVSVPVSATSLSLHSPLLRGLLYPNEQLAKEVELDIDPNSFFTFLKLTAGFFPADCIVELLDSLSSLGATEARDATLEKMKSDLFCPGASPTAAKMLLQYVVKKNPLDLIAMRIIVGYLKEKDFEEAMVSYNSLSKDVKLSLRVHYENQYQIFVNNLSGRVHAYVSSPTSTGLELKTMVEWREGIPIDFMRLICNAAQLEENRTLHEHKIINESTVHLTMKLKGC